MPSEPGVIDILKAGLQGTSLRGKVIANNIANLDTPGYRRKDVRFEAALAKALRDPTGMALRKAAPEIFEPRTLKADATGNDVELDLEVGEMIKNGAMYKTYVRLLARMYGQMQLAISGRQ